MKSDFLENIEEFNELTLHVVLATVPQRQEQRFNKCITEDFYGEYSKNAKDYLTPEDGEEWYGSDDEKLRTLYNPLRYYLLGNYDIAYIALIDNYKFVQRVFEPQLLPIEDEDPKLFSSHTFQSFSGICFDSASFLRDLFNRKLSGKSNHYFLSITNLKLNNGFLIGNGEEYLTSVVQLIRLKIAEANEDIKIKQDKIEFMVMQSFSWFELSLMIFSNDPANITKIIKTLRGCSLLDLPERESLLEKSLYKEIFEKEAAEQIIDHANVFADTHTYFGLHADLIEKSAKSSFFKAFYEKKITLTTEIEWQVKPGHMHLLLPLLEKHTEQLFYFGERYLLAGKNDYLIKNASNCINNNVELLRFVQHPDKELYHHVRKIKTRVYFADSNPKKDEKERSVLDLHKNLVNLGIKICDFSEIDTNLKSLKISRQIRSKVLKIFSNYNNGIQDIILFPFFLDFKIFISHLIDIIETPAERLATKFAEPRIYIPDLNVADLEVTLMNLINIFQEGYNIRMLNGYQFEDINDFDLDFNSSIQQLLSVYSTIAIEIGNLFYKEKYKYGPVVQLNLKDTVSTYMSINYYVHHLTSPEFVFATLTKEILNFLYVDDHRLGTMFMNYEKDVAGYFSKNSMLQDMLDTDLIVINNLVNDALRFIISFDLDFELFYYWDWTYNLQNASLYDETGSLNEDRFRVELFRILFINYFFSCKIGQVFCPLPELYSYWDRHFVKMKDAVAEFCKFLENSPSKLATAIMDHLVSKMDLSYKFSQDEFIFEEQGVLAGGKFLNRVQAKYAGTYTDEGSLKRISKKIRIYEVLDAGNPDKKIPDDSIIYLQWYMLNYIRAIYKLNYGKTVLLRRNWFDGRPLRSFLQHDPKDHLYAVDQTGGLFFDNSKSLNLYFKLSTKALKYIWSFSQKKKKQFIIRTFQTNNA